MNEKIAYILGFFYADSHLQIIQRAIKNGTATYYGIRLEILSSDSDDLKRCLDSQNIKYTLSKRMRKNSKNEQTSFYLLKTNPLFNLFQEVLSDKIDMTKSKNIIPINLYKYFLRGFFDGDGCISISKNGRSRLYFYGSYNQDWKAIFDVLNNLNIKYNYTQTIRKEGKHKSSFICISNKKDINKLFEFIYPNKQYDFGLYRKFEKLNT